MSPRKFPERARKSCMVSNHFPSRRLPFVSVQIFSSLPRLLSFYPYPQGRKGRAAVPIQGPEKETKAQLEGCGPWGTFLLLGAFQEGRIVLVRY